MRDKYGQVDPLGDDGARRSRDGAQVDDEVDAVLDRAQVTEGLAELPAREREVLMLVYLQDMTLEECAQVLEVPFRNGQIPAVSRPTAASRPPGREGIHVMTERPSYGPTGSCEG